MTENDQKILDDYPKVILTEDQFINLPEYSTSNPTQSGNMGVKEWKHRTPFDASVDDAIWFFGKVEGDEIKFYHITGTPKQ